MSYQQPPLDFGEPTERPLRDCYWVVMELQHWDQVSPSGGQITDGAPGAHPPTHWLAVFEDVVSAHAWCRAEVAIEGVQLVTRPAQEAAQ